MPLIWLKATRKDVAYKCLSIWSVSRMETLFGLTVLLIKMTRNLWDSMQVSYAECRNLQKADCMADIQIHVSLNISYISYTR